MLQRMVMPAHGAWRTNKGQFSQGNAEKYTQLLENIIN